MGPSPQTENRSAERSPLGKPQRGKRGGNRGRKPAKQRITEHARDRTELWHRGNAAKVRDEDKGKGVPLSFQVHRLTEELELAFNDLRHANAGNIPSAPRQPETMHAENTRRRKTKLPKWRGE